MVSADVYRNWKKRTSLIVESKIYENASHALTDGLEQMKGYAKWVYGDFAQI